MENNFKELKPKIKALGIYQVAGGIIGLGLTLWSMAGYINNIEYLLFILFSIALGLYIYSVYCGILLLKNSKAGLKHSLINQGLQMVSFSFFGFAFQYIAGVYFTIGIDLTDGFYAKFKTGFSSWQIIVNNDEQLLFVNVNLVAIFLIFFIEKLKKRISKIEEEAQLANIIVTE